MTKLGKYFTLEELIASSTADKAGINNVPPHDAVVNLKLLVDNILDPAREMLGEPIYVNSGYRCYELNKILLGSKTSQHLKGQAADIYTIHMNKLLDILKTLTFDQFIIYKTKGFYHISYDDNRNRKQILYL